MGKRGRGLKFFGEGGREIFLDWFHCEVCQGKWSWPRGGWYGDPPEQHPHCPGEVGGGAQELEEEP